MVKLYLISYMCIFTRLGNKKYNLNKSSYTFKLKLFNDFPNLYEILKDEST